MKLYLPLIALLTLIPTPLIPKPVIAAETQLVASEIEPELKEYARSISVKVAGNNKNNGSGVIIGKQGDKYLVITNNHVVGNSKSLSVQTADGANHQASIVDNPVTSDDDIALLTFNSTNDYQPVQLNSTNTGKEAKRIYAVGFSAETGQFVVEPGTIDRIPDQPFKEGYQIGYTNNIVSGMSGGAIFDKFGDLVGINGIGAFPILNTAYQYQDETTPTAAEIEQFRSLSWGLSVHRLLTQLNSEIITAYNLPLPETKAEVGNTVLTGWLGKLETKAKQISVRIDSSSGANGSGVIIAKEGNTYTVLTADHVLCEKDEETNNCIDYVYEIVTPDGQKYSIDANTVIRQEGVDLAVFKFNSQADYQVAELANYPTRNNDAIFVAGYPKLGDNPQWRFSPGYGFEKEQGLLKVNINNNSAKSESSNSLSGPGSLADGYEMVYTSVTYGGMSGGAVLDREGRVIGIHGLAEGETALDSQNGSQNIIQLGRSLGIPIDTFIGLTDRFEINTPLSIQENQPRELNAEEEDTFKTAILGTEISQGNATAQRWLERGNQLWRLRRYEEAVRAFDKAIILNPEFVHLAYYGKGLALVSQEKHELALASLELATKTKPDFVPAFFSKSVTLRQLNRLEKALVAIESASVLQPDNANFYNQKGWIVGKLNRYEQAEAAYERAIKINPLASFYSDRGTLYQDQGRLDLALANYNQALKTNPNFAIAYNNRGFLYKSQGKLV